MDSNLAQIAQFYAPLAGLLLFAFILGSLHQRVRSLERNAREDEDIKGRLILWEERSKQNSEALEALKKQVEGVHREINELIRSRIRSGLGEIERV